MTYYIYLATSPKFSTGTIIQNTQVSPNTYTYVDGLNAGTYYWKIYAEGNGGGNQSTVYNFTIVTPPTLLSPANGVIINNNTLTFDWTDVQIIGKDVKYIVEVRDENGVTVSINNNIMASTFTASEVYSDGSYTWKVTPYSEEVKGDIVTYPPSNDYTFTIKTADTTSPSSPMPIFPENGAVINDNTLTFDWTDVTDPSGVRYIIQISINQEFSSHTSPVTSARWDGALLTSTYQVPDTVTQTDGTYYWRVYAIDGAGNVSPSSSVASYTVKTTPQNVIPSAPVLLSPQNGATVSSAPELDWGDVKDSDGIKYILEVSTDPNFSSAFNPTLSTSSYKLDEKFDDDTYYWRVYAVDGKENYSPPSMVFSFTINVKPPPNVPPIAKAGPDQTIKEDSMVYLDGSESYDPDEKPESLSFHWSQTFGPHVDLINSGSAFPSFTAPQTDQKVMSLKEAAELAYTKLIFELVVNDGKDESKPDSVIILVQDTGNPPNPPIAIDDNVSIEQGTMITLNVLGNDYDKEPDDTIKIISVSSPQYGTVRNNDDGTVTYVQSADFVGTDYFTYTISDKNGLESSATVRVIVNPVYGFPWEIIATTAIVIGGGGFAVYKFIHKNPPPKPKPHRPEISQTNIHTIRIEVNGGIQEETIDDPSLNNLEDKVKQDLAPTLDKIFKNNENLTRWGEFYKVAYSYKIQAEARGVSDTEIEQMIGAGVTIKEAASESLLTTISNNIISEIMKYLPAGFVYITIEDIRTQVKGLERETTFNVPFTGILHPFVEFLLVIDEMQRIPLAKVIFETDFTGTISDTQIISKGNKKKIRLGKLVASVSVSIVDTALTGVFHVSKRIPLGTIKEFEIDLSKFNLPAKFLKN